LSSLLEQAKDLVIRSFVLLMPFYMACGYWGEDVDEQPLARVKDDFLYPSDITNLTSRKMSKEDSALVVNNYINNWINEMLLIHKAELNLKEEQKNFDKQLQNYRKSLLIYEYEKKIIQQRLDTTVSLEAIEDYYLTNQQNFILKEDLAKITYARIPNDAPRLERVRKWYKSSDPDDIDKLIDYCHQFALVYYDEDSWMELEDLLALIPLKVENPGSFLRYNKHVELQDSVSFYFVNVRDYKIKNSTSPLSFEKNRIRSIIINQRKLELLKTMKQDLYNRALAKKDFEIYD
jgi:hypothetical protein